MEVTQLRQIAENFAHELQLGNERQPSSLPFIVHQLSSTPILKDQELAEVIVVGGSIFKKALIKKSGEKIEIVEKLPDKKVKFENGQDLLTFIEQELYADVHILALNFAYPMKPVFANNKQEGILVSGSKETSFEGLIGENIAEEIEKYILQKKGRKISVSLANDTICLLLSGLIDHSWDSLAGGVVGTGLNFALFLEKDKLVNLESANFDKFEQSDEGRQIDAASKQIGTALFEKETSGAYLYQHFNLLLKKKNLDFAPIESTVQMNDIAHQNLGEVTKLAHDVLDRSAALVACQVAGIEIYKQRSINFVIEGSLFWYAKDYRDNIYRYAKMIAPEYEPSLLKVEDSSIIGAAKLIA